MPNEPDDSPEEWWEREIGAVTALRLAMSEQNLPMLLGYVALFQAKGLPIEALYEEAREDHPEIPRLADLEPQRAVAPNR